jgi:hypothetical protein
MQELVGCFIRQFAAGVKELVCPVNTRFPAAASPE